MSEKDAIEVAYKNGYEAGRESTIHISYWIDSVIDGYYLCANCGKLHDQNYNYCNECGAKMGKMVEINGKKVIQIIY